MLFGANVGTTLTAQLLAMDLDWLGRPALAAGFCLAVAARQPSAQGAGRALFGFGMLFEGVHLMEKTLAPMAQAPFFRQMLIQVSQHPVWGLALGLGMTLLAQSSSATVAVLQQAAAQPIPGSTVSLLGLAGAVPVLLGENLGTTVTAWLASLGRGRAARQVAAAHTIFNLSGAAVCLAALPWFVALVQRLPPFGPECARDRPSDRQRTHPFQPVLCRSVDAQHPADGPDRGPAQWPARYCRGEVPTTALNTSPK